MSIVSKIASPPPRNTAVKMKPGATTIHPSIGHARSTSTPVSVSSSISKRPVDVDKKAALPAGGTKLSTPGLSNPKVAGSHVAKASVGYVSTMKRASSLPIYSKMSPTAPVSVPRSPPSTTARASFAKPTKASVNRTSLPEAFGTPVRRTAICQPKPVRAGSPPAKVLSKAATASDKEEAVAKDEGAEPVVVAVVEEDVGDIHITVDAVVENTASPTALKAKSQKVDGLETAKCRPVSVAAKKPPPPFPKRKVGKENYLTVPEWTYGFETPKAVTTKKKVNAEKKPPRSVNGSRFVKPLRSRSVAPSPPVKVEAKPSRAFKPTLGGLAEEESPSETGKSATTIMKTSPPVHAGTVSSPARLVTKSPAEKPLPAGPRVTAGLIEDVLALNRLFSNAAFSADDEKLGQKDDNDIGNAGGTMVPVKPIVVDGDIGNAVLKAFEHAPVSASIKSVRNARLVQPSTVEYISPDLLVNEQSAVVEYWPPVGHDAPVAAPVPIVNVASKVNKDTSFPAVWRLHEQPSERLMSKMKRSYDGPVMMAEVLEEIAEEAEVEYELEAHVGTGTTSPPEARSAPAVKAIATPRAERRYGMVSPRTLQKADSDGTPAALLALASKMTPTSRAERRYGMVSPKPLQKIGSDCMPEVQFIPAFQATAIFRAEHRFGVISPKAWQKTDSEHMEVSGILPTLEVQIDPCATSGKILPVEDGVSYVVQSFLEPAIRAPQKMEKLGPMSSCPPQADLHASFTEPFAEDYEASRPSWDVSSTSSSSTSSSCSFTGLRSAWSDWTVDSVSTSPGFKESLRKLFMRWGRK